MVSVQPVILLTKKYKRRRSYVNTIELSISIKQKNTIFSQIMHEYVGGYTFKK